MRKSMWSAQSKCSVLAIINIPDNPTTLEAGTNPIFHIGTLRPKKVNSLPMVMNQIESKSGHSDDTWLQKPGFSTM